MISYESFVDGDPVDHWETTLILEIGEESEKFVVQLELFNCKACSKEKGLLSWESFEMRRGAQHAQVVQDLFSWRTWCSKRLGQ